MISFDELFAELKNSIIDLAKNNWEDFKDAVIIDGTSFLIEIKDDIENWAHQLAEGQISTKDFEWLVMSKKDLAELKALRDIGLAKASMDKLVNELLNTIVTKTVAKVL